MIEVKNGITELIDEYRKDTHISEFFSTYLMDPHKPMVKEGRIYIPIREVGQTVGGVILDDNNVIKDIILNSDNKYFPYKESVREAVKKYIGYTITIKEGVVK